MHKSNLLVFMYFCLLAKVLSAPVTNIQYTCNENTLLKYAVGSEYFYDYSTQTSLWINDVSEESKSSVELKAKVVIRAVDKCLYMLRLEDVSLSGETVQGASSVADDLAGYAVQFRMNSDGELDTNLEFVEGDKPWSRNIKRGILSAFQAKSIKDLRSVEGQDKKSAVIYETDVLGRCRTTYSTKDDASSAQISLKKKKSLNRCTLNENSKTSAIQYTPYKNLPEFNKGKLFLESYECETKIKNGLIDSVDCEEKSTYKRGSRGTKGVQAVVKQSLDFKSQRAGYDKRNYGPFSDKEDITFEYSDKSVDDLEYKNLDVNKFLDDICSRTKGQEKSGLDVEHANNFRALVNKLESSSDADLLKLYNDAKKKCVLAGTTVSNALIFTNTDNSLKAILKLLDSDELSAQRYITEYPILTALARNQDASLATLKSLKSYVQSKGNDFKYLKKLYLVYSSLVKSYCKNNDCDEKTLDDLAGFLSSNLGSDCSDSSKKDLVTVTLKAIGNAGYAKDTSVLVKCAKNDKNSMEVRVSALQAFRRMSCEKVASQAGIAEILRDGEEDAELRITAFQTLIKCSNSEKFQEAAKNLIPAFLEKERDLQVLTYIVDYAKEHGITAILNPILNDQRLKEKFSVNFKQLSWNNYHYRYSIIRDGAVEVDTSVIFDTKKAFLPRSIRVNATIQLYGMAINFLDVTVRMEGLDEILRWAVVEKLRSADILKRITEKPEELIDILKKLADKLSYTSDKPYLSILLRIYGSDVFYSELDNAEKLKKLGEFIKAPRDKLLYSDIDTIRNMFLIDSRVRQPLSNGFEFNTFMDSTLSLFINKESKKTETDGKKDFKVDNFYSSSIAINKRFEVQLNKENKLALKKKAVLNTRLNLNVEGTKTNTTQSYKVSLRPQKDLTLLSFTGKFYKLAANSEYKEVTKFSVEQRQVDKCTTDNFKSSVGVQFCLSVKRPKVGSLKNLIWPEQTPVEVDEDDDDDDDDDDEDEDDDDDDEDENVDKNIKRPRLTLSGPYSYQLTLKNPDLITSVIVNGKLERNPRLVSYNAKLQTKSASGTQDRLEFSYARQRNYTNLKIDRSISIELKRPQTNDVRFKFLAKILFIKKQIIHLNLNVQSKILRDLSANLEFKRDKSADGVAPLYKIEALLDSKLRKDKPKYKKLSINLKPNGRDINGDFVVEFADERSSNQVKKVAGGVLKLTANKDSGVDYTVDLKTESMSPSNSHIYGKVAANLLESNIDLNFEHDGQKFDLAEPANLKLGHKVNSEGTITSTQVFAHLKAATANRKINHGARITLEANPATMKPSFLEVQVSTLKTAENSNLPYTVYIGKRVSTESTKTTTEYSAGIKNINIDLSARSAESGFVRSLIKVDNNNFLKALGFSYKRVKDSSDSSLSATINVKKNEANLSNIQVSLQGTLKALKETPEEVPKQNFGALVSAKILDYAGLIEAKATLESSSKSKQHALTLDVRTDNFFKILLKVGSIKSKIEVNGAQSKIAADFEIQKLGEVKNWKLKTSNGQLRKSGSNFEFDVNYEKNLANGQKHTGTGTVKYEWENAKNWKANLDIPNKFFFKINIDNDRKSTETIFGDHEIILNYGHLDAQPEERYWKLDIEGTKESNIKKLKFNVLSKKGQPGKLDDKDSLHYLLDLNTNNAFLDNGENNRTLVEGANSLDLRLKQFNIELKLKNAIKLDTKAKTFSLKAEKSVKFPAIISDPGKLNQAESKLNYNIDLAANKRTLTYNLKTNNKLIGKYFKELDVDYSREITTSGLNKNHKISVDLDLTTADDQKKNVNAQIEKTQCKEDSNDICQGTKVTLKQNVKPVYTRKLKEGTIDISDCTWNSRLVRVKSAAKYALEVVGQLKCGSEQIVDNTVLINRNKEAKSLRVKIAHDSDTIYPKKSLELNIKRFNKRNGHFELSVKSDKVDYSSKFSYERQLNEATGKLQKGQYKLQTSFGETASKTCELNIESKTDYYNKLSCSVKTSKLPVKLNYGYSLKVANKRDLLFGKRNIELDINLPSTRVLKLKYIASHAIQIDAVDPINEDDDNDNDDNDEENNHREFNATLTYYWDHTKQPTKYVQLNAKRENLAKGQSKLTVDVLNYPKLKLFKFEVERVRSFNQTNVDIGLSYETESGKTNRLDIDAILSSDSDSISYSIEANLQKPKFNVLYDNSFNRYNGRLQYLEVRLAKLIKLRIDKESDPENRKISVELVNPDETYNVDASRTDAAGVYNVNSQLKKSGRSLSKLDSKFDSNNNVLDVTINGKYRLNLGVFSEKLGDLSITNVQENKKLALGTLKVVEDDDDQHHLELKLKWNRFWSAIQKDILANQDQTDRAKTNTQYNSYLGDVWSQLSQDLKVAYDTMSEERAPVKKDAAQLAAILLDFYSNFVSEKHRGELKSWLEKKMSERKEENEKINALPFHKRVYTRYNQVADALNKLYLRVRSKSKRLARLVPKLPKIVYTSGSDSDEFANNVVITRATRKATNLYQANAIYRNSLRKLAERVLNAKGNLARNTKSYSSRGLFNKYKYRPLDSYTVLGAVFNRRNVIRFNGLSKTLKTQCQFLLTHDLVKNKFSVILNNNKQEGILSVYAYGQPAIDINAESAFIGGKKIALPYKYENKNKPDEEIIVRRIHNGVRLELEDELLVECHADSKTCIVGLTRFSIGKVNGLLGRSSYDTERNDEDYWFLGSECKLQNLQAKAPSTEAVKSCYEAFGRHRKSIFKDAFESVKPTGWQRVCEAALTNDIKNKCTLMKAFTQFARTKYVDVDEPNECYQCKANDKTYNVGQTIENAQNAFEQSNDFVFVLLPCDYSKNFNDLLNNIKKVKDQLGNNRYYFVQADENGASVYQNEAGQTYNFEIKKALQTISESRTSNNLDKKDFYKALFLAGSLFTNRLAQNRLLVIVSCGNCIDYKMLSTLKLNRKLKARNIVVSSWGAYTLTDTDGSLDSNERAVGYAHGKLFVRKVDTNEVDTDSLSAYRVEHNQDLCSRLAVKTKGAVFDINEIKTTKIFESTMAKLRELRPSYENTLEKCERISTPFGDVTDFKYKKAVKVSSDAEEDDDEDDDTDDDDDDDN